MPEVIKTATFYSNKRSGPKTFHIEVDGAIVNITIGLTTRGGRAVTRVDVIPDDEHRGGDGNGRLWKQLPGDDPRIVRLHEDERELPADLDHL
jgi:hypothetical protein